MCLLNLFISAFINAFTYLLMSSLVMVEHSRLSLRTLPSQGSGPMLAVPYELTMLKEKSLAGEEHSLAASALEAFSTPEVSSSSSEWPFSGSGLTWWSIASSSPEQIKMKTRVKFFQIHPQPLIQSRSPG